MLSKRWIINYVLILLILLFTWIGNRYDVQTGFQPAGDKNARRIAALDAAEVTRIDISTADAALSLGRDAGGWSLIAPVDWPADNANIDRLLGILRLETDSRLAAGEIDLATLGLLRPRALLRLNDTTIHFGDANNIGQRRYLMIDEVVYLVDDNHLPFLTQGLAGLVDRRLLPRRLGAEALSLPGIELERGADGAWVARGEANFGADQIAELAENWVALPATRIEPYRDGQTPRQKLRARLDGGREIEFFLMSIDPEIVIANPSIGLQYRFRSDYYYRLISLRADEDSA